MTLPASGLIKASQVSTELGRASAAGFSMNNAIERCLADIAANPVEIRLSSFYNKSQIKLTDTRTTAAASHTTVDYGLDCSQRRMAFFIWHNDTTGNPGVPTCTVSGAGATRIGSRTTGLGEPPDYATGVALFTAAPAGANGTVAPSWGGLNTTLVAIRTLAYTLSSSFNYEDDGGLSSDGRVGMNVPSNGLILSAAGAGNSASAFTWSGLTERGDESAGNRRTWAWDDFQPESTGDSRIIDVDPWSGTHGANAMLCASFSKLF